MKSILFFAAFLLLLLAPGHAQTLPRPAHAEEHAEPACVTASRRSSCPISAEMSDEQIRRCLKSATPSRPPARPLRSRKRPEATQTARAN